MIFLGRLPILMISNYFAVSIPYIASIGYLLYFALLDPIASVYKRSFNVNLYFSWLRHHFIVVSLIRRVKLPRIMEINHGLLL